MDLQGHFGTGKRIAEPRCGGQHGKTIQGGIPKTGF